MHAQQDFIYGESVSIPNNPHLWRDGYEFECWNTMANGSGASYYPGDRAVIQGGNTTLYAKWKVCDTMLRLTNGAYSGFQFPVNATIRVYDKFNNYHDYTWNGVPGTKDINAFPGCKIVFYHDSSREWEVGGTVIGKGPACRFTVPSNAASYTDAYNPMATLSFYEEDWNGRGYGNFVLRYSYRWGKDVAISLGE